jgi:LAGLIDADG DNA endonuclease family
MISLLPPLIRFAETSEGGGPLKEIIIGLALGDLYIRKRNKNTCLCFKQSIKNEAYIIHLYTIFQEYCKMSPRIKNVPIKEKVHESIYFDTLT